MREGQADPLQVEAAMSRDEVGRWPWLDPFLLTLFFPSNPPQDAGSGMLVWGSKG
mgnify:CR=1 FL=1